MTLELDLHGLTPSIAIQRIQRFIEDKNNLHNKRVIKTLPVPFNAGRTFIFLNSKNS